MAVRIVEINWVYNSAGDTRKIMVNYDPSTKYPNPNPGQNLKNFEQTIHAKYPDYISGITQVAWKGMRALYMNWMVLK